MQAQGLTFEKAKESVLHYTLTAYQTLCGGILVMIVNYRNVKDIQSHT